MDDLAAAVAEYMRREKAANADMRGADHMLLLSDVATEYGIEIDILTETVLDRTFSGGN